MNVILQGIAYYILGLGALLNFIAFIVTKRRRFLYLSVVFTFSLGIYLGFFRTQMRKKFNIRVSIYVSLCFNFCWLFDIVATWDGYILRVLLSCFIF
jgi:hypothetical protein